MTLVKIDLFQLTEAGPMLSVLERKIDHSISNEVHEQAIMPLLRLVRSTVAVIIDDEFRYRRFL